MTKDATAFALGFTSWTLLEYGIHGVLSHRWRTPAAAMHASHHADPRAVFTPPVAWLPALGVVTAASVLVLGRRSGLAFALGTLAGFARYERFHYRIHFDEPRNDRERALFAHHMSHHYRDRRRAHGVTTRAWDRVFGTMPAEGAPQRKMRGASNFRDVYSWRGSFKSVRDAKARYEASTQSRDAG